MFLVPENDDLSDASLARKTLCWLSDINPSWQQYRILICDKRESSIGNYANSNHYDSVDCTSYRRMSCFKTVKMARLQQLFNKICCMHLLTFMCSSLVTRVVIGSKKIVLCCEIVIFTNTNSHKHNFTKTQFHNFIIQLCLLQVHFCKSFRILLKLLL